MLFVAIIPVGVLVLVLMRCEPWFGFVPWMAAFLVFLVLLALIAVGVGV